MGRRAVHIELAAKIHSGIASFQDGWELDPIRSYARRYGVSPTTVRKALASLAKQGIIESRQKGRYVRTHATGWDSYPRTYPVVGLLACTGLPLMDDGYVSRLLRSFIGTIQVHKVPVCLLPDIRALAMRLVPGGVSLGPTQIGCSAVAFLFGAEEQRLAELVQHGLVVMTLDYLSSTEGVDSVVVDCQDEAQRVVRFLFDLGHRHIAFVGHAMGRNPGHWQGGIDPDTRRFAADVLVAKQTLGLDISPRYHEISTVDSLGSDAPLRQTLQRLLRVTPTPTAIITFSSGTAQQMREILHEWGIRCPSHMSIVTRTSSPCEDDFTKLVADPMRMGGTAAQHILDRLRNLSCMPTRLLFPSSLIEGGTTAAPRAAP